MRFFFKPVILLNNQRCGVKPKDKIKMGCAKGSRKNPPPIKAVPIKTLNPPPFLEPFARRALVIRRHFCLASAKSENLFGKVGRAFSPHPVADATPLSQFG
jgi:hypothetical protein